MAKGTAKFLLCLAVLSSPQLVQARDLDAPVADQSAAVQRVVQLEQGSNFRDIGGYRTVDGKTVRWGRIYRSGGTPLLTDADVAKIKKLGITQMVDLRSSEERVLAPTRLGGLSYSAANYSMTALMGAGADGAVPSAEKIYRAFPAMLAPQLRVLFHRLADNDGAVVYNCSAGQDRTGFTTAVVLSSLGVSREDIIKDYLMSTALRRPQYEMPRIDIARNADNPVALMFARWQQPPHDKPSPLYDKGGAYLRYSLDEMDKRWGSAENYLRQEVGVSEAELQAIRASYLN